MVSQKGHRCVPGILSHCATGAYGSRDRRKAAYDGLTMKFLLLPGLDGTGRLFEPFVSRAPEDADITFARYPVDRDLSYPECAELVLSECLPDGEFVIIAESFSGPVAVLAAANHPRGLVGLVLCNTFVYRASWRGFGLLPWSLLIKMPLSQLSVGIHLTGFGRAAEFVGIIRAANKPVLPTVRASRLRSALAVDVRPEFAALDLPIMDLRGDHDRLVLGNCARRVMQTRPATTAVTIPGPHLLLQTEPEQCWREIVAFVESHCRG